MFQISGDAIAGIVVGFALGVLVYWAYDKLMYEVTKEEKPTTEKNPERIEPPEGEPMTYGRSCQKFSSAMNIDSPDKCQYLTQTSGRCALFNRQVFILGGKYERCAECKEKYP